MKMVMQLMIVRVFDSPLIPRKLRTTGSNRWHWNETTSTIVITITWRGTITCYRSPIKDHMINSRLLGNLNFQYHYFRSHGWRLGMRYELILSRTRVRYASRYIGNVMPSDDSGRDCRDQKHTIRKVRIAGDTFVTWLDDMTTP